MTNTVIITTNNFFGDQGDAMYFTGCSVLGVPMFSYDRNKAVEIEEFNAIEGAHQVMDYIKTKMAEMNHSHIELKAS